MEYAGSTALVTGASSGLGEAISRELAYRRANLVLVARRENALKQLAEEFGDRNNVAVDHIVADLTEDGAAARVRAVCEERGHGIDVLVNNAGFSTFGGFETIPTDREREMVLLNSAAVVDMSHEFIPGMLERGRGAVLNIASLVALLPLPYQAAYAATKAFVLSFSEALWAQYRNRGVHVTALCPGAIETPFYEVMQSEGMKRRHKENPSDVAKKGLDALASNKSWHVTTAKNFLTVSPMRRFLPRSTVAILIEKMFPSE